MGFLSRVSNFFNQTGPKIWNAVKQGASTGYNAIHSISSKIGSVADGIDHAVTQARSIPVIGHLAEALQAHPIYNEIKAGIKVGTGLVDEVGKVGSEIGNTLDKFIPPPSGG